MAGSRQTRKILQATLYNGIREDLERILAQTKYYETTQDMLGRSFGSENAELKSLILLYRARKREILYNIFESIVIAYSLLQLQRELRPRAKHYSQGCVTHRARDLIHC